MTKLLFPKIIAQLFFLAFLIFGYGTQANPINAPEAPLDHCYHWLHESRRYLTHKYLHAEATGGEFSFQTSQGGHAAGAGIYCAKTVIGSAGYGDRIIRIDFTEDTVFQTVSGKNVCRADSSSQDCHTQKPDVISFQTGNGWYVIKNPEAILSWSASSDQLRADIVEMQKAGYQISELKNVIARMDEELKSRPKGTYFNPKARKGLLKLLNEDENNAVKIASVGTLQAVQKLKDSDFSPDKKQSVFKIMITVFGQKTRYRDLVAAHALFPSNPEMQDFILESLRTSLTPEIIATLDLNSMAELDGLVPEKFDEETIQSAFANSARNSKDLDGLIASASKSPKLQPALDAFDFTAEMVARFQNKASVAIALRNTVRKGNIYENRVLLINALVALARFSAPGEFTNEVQQTGILANEHTADLAKIFFGEQSGFRNFDPNQFNDLLSRFYSQADPRIFVQSVASAMMNSADWLYLSGVFAQLSYLQPHLGLFLPDSFEPLQKVAFTPEAVQSLYNIELALNNRAAKLSSKELEYYKAIFEILHQDKLCSGNVLVDLTKLENFKSGKLTYANMLSNFVSNGLKTKDAGLLKTNCRVMAFGYGLTIFEKKLPAELVKKAWAYFDSIKYPTDQGLQNDAKIFGHPVAAELFKYPTLEWKLFEKALDHQISRCTNENANCRFDLWIAQYFEPYLVSRMNTKESSTLRLVSRISDYLVKKNLPTVAWISFKLESRFFSNNSENSRPLTNYFELYASKAATPDFKKRFEYFFDHSLDHEFFSNFMTYLSERNEKEKPELNKAAKVLAIRLANNFMNRRFNFISKNPAYKLNMSGRENPYGRYYNSLRTNNVHCYFLDRSLRSHSSALAKITDIPQSDIITAIGEETQKACQ